MRWEHEEILTRASYTQSRVLPSVVTELVFLVYSVWTAGVWTRQVWGFVGAIIFTVAPGVVIPKTEVHGKKWCVFVYFEATQTMVMLAAVYVQPGISSLFCIVCTLILAISEVTPVYPMWLNLILVCKHLGLWTYIISSNCAFTFFPFGIFPIAWSIFHIILVVSKKCEILQVMHKSIQALRREERRMESLLHSIPDGVAVVSQSLELITFNKSFAEQLGLQKSANNDERMRIITELTYETEYVKEGGVQRLIDDIWKLIESGVGNVMNFPPVTRFDIFLECRGVVSQWDDQRVCILTVRDTTKWVELEQKAQSESDRKTSMLRSVSHELRTPTNAILNLTMDLQASEELSQQGFSDTSVIISATSFLLSLINDLLDFSRIIHGKFSLIKKHFPLLPMLKHCLSLLEPQCKSKKIELKSRFDPDLPLIIYSDENRIRQVVLNLLSNALKFTLKGSITLIAMSVDSTKVNISVEDTGIGISTSDQSRIFQLFGKLEGNQKMNPQGCGLGLGISSLLVERLGEGGINVKSEVGKGSVFSFVITTGFETGECEEPRTDIDTETDCPNALECPSQTVSWSADWSGSYHPSTLAPDVLIVDDSSFNRIVARKLVESRGYTCVEASTGVQALNTLNSYSSRGLSFSVILMDIEMPEMNGISATLELRDRERRQDTEQRIVIIGCSANSTMEDKTKAIEAGMNYYIEKPIMREELYRLLEMHIG